MTRFRKWLANLLAGWARRIHPVAPEVLAFQADRMMDLILTGNSFIKVTGVPPQEVFIDAAGTLKRHDAASRSE